MLLNFELSNHSKCKKQTILYKKITKINFDPKSCLGPFNNLSEKEPYVTSDILKQERSALARLRFCILPGSWSV